MGVATNGWGYEMGDAMSFREEQQVQCRRVGDFAETFRMILAVAILVGIALAPIGLFSKHAFGATLEFGPHSWVTRYVVRVTQYPSLEFTENENVKPIPNIGMSVDLDGLKPNIQGGFYISVKACTPTVCGGWDWVQLTKTGTYSWTGTTWREIYDYRIFWPSPFPTRTWRIKK
jgi:hypothetical protein